MSAVKSLMREDNCNREWALLLGPIFFGGGLMLTRNWKFVTGLAALALLAAVPGRAMAQRIIHVRTLQLQPTADEPVASGEVVWGLRFWPVRPPLPGFVYRFFQVTVRDVSSTDLVEVRINGVPLDIPIPLTNGQGRLWLDDMWEVWLDCPPSLRSGDLVEIYDANDHVTLLLWGVVEP